MNTFTKNQYWKSKGFVSDPFSLGRNDQYFISPAWEEYLDLLPQFVRFCNTLLLVTGDAEVGKSSLINQFIREKVTDTKVLHIHAEDCSGVEYLLQLLHDEFSAPLNKEANVTATQQLDLQLEYLSQHQQHRLLIIDDADQLPLDMRQACLQIVQQQSAVNTCLPVILVGSNELNSQFNALLTPTTAKECLHEVFITPLTLEQTDAYIRWCCLQAGGNRQLFPFTDEDIETIYKNSQGAMGKINTAAQQSLQQQGKPHDFNWRNIFKGKLLWWTLTVIVIVILLYIYQLIIRPPELSKTFTQPLTVRAPQPEKPADKDYQIGDTILKSQPASAEKMTQPAPVKTKPAKPMMVTKPVAKTPEIVKPIAEKATMPEVKTPESKASETKTEPVLFKSIMQQRLQAQQQQIEKINPQSYTLQLVAGQDLAAIQKFILQHQIQATALIAKVTRQQKTGYIVVYGVFPSAQAAKQGVSLLPGNLRTQKPWPRSYKSIQEMLKSTDEK